jgi:hypothetical protein
MFEATVESPGGQIFSTKYDTADLAARMLVVMLTANGWEGDESEVIQQLVSGEPLEFRKLTYQVQEA